MFDRFFFAETFSEHHVRQPTLIRDASRAPRSDVAALRRRGNSQNPRFGAEIPSLTRLAEAEGLTIPPTTVDLAGVQCAHPHTDSSVHCVGGDSKKSSEHSPVLPSRVTTKHRKVVSFNRTFS